MTKIVIPSRGSQGDAENQSCWNRDLPRALCEARRRIPKHVRAFGPGLENFAVISEQRLEDRDEHATRGEV